MRSKILNGTTPLYINIISFENNTCVVQIIYCIFYFQFKRKSNEYKRIIINQITDLCAIRKGNCN